MGKHDHVRHRMAWTDIPVGARNQSMVGAGDSGGYRCGVLSVAVTSGPEGRTASRMTSMIRFRSFSVSEAYTGNCSVCAVLSATGHFVLNPSKTSSTLQMSTCMI